MSKIIILGATGSLGRHVVQQAVAANHGVSVLTRSLPVVLLKFKRKFCRPPGGSL